MNAVLDAMIADDRLTSFALGVLAIEMILLLQFAATRIWVNRKGIVANCLSGACLLLALQAAMREAGSDQVVLWLSLGLVAHLWDLATRLRKP